MVMESNAQGSSSVKVLVVEEFRVDTRILSIMLHHFHCETTMAENGKEAVDLFFEGNKFDIVFLDKLMPVMTGPEAVVKIRAMGDPDVKIVGLSTYDDDKEAFMCAGADVFAAKPIKLDFLGGMIQEVINKKNNTMVEA